MWLWRCGDFNWPQIRLRRLEEVEGVDLDIVAAEVAAEGGGLVEGFVEGFAELFAALGSEDDLEAVFVFESGDGC